MASYRIPPIGYCAVCLALDADNETPAFAMWQGTGLCKTHLAAVVKPLHADLENIDVLGLNDPK